MAKRSIARRVRRTRTARKPKPAEKTAVRRAGDGSGLAPGMQTINTYLAVANIGATMSFLEKAFGF